MCAKWCLVALCLSFVAGVVAESRQNPTLVFNPSVDPLGEEDGYKQLTQLDVEEKWSVDDGKTLQDRSTALRDFSVATHVDVKLVGFSGDGNYKLALNTADFLRFLEASLTEDSHVYAQHPEPGVPHRLPIRHRYFFRVQKAKPSLAQEITKVVHSHVMGKKKSHVPVEEVDKIIQKDFEESGLSYVIYLLNPIAPAITRTVQVNATSSDDEAHEEEQRELFTYWYTPSADTRGSVKGDEEFKPCPTVLWSGKQDRYAWIDFTAGPITYGPHTSGNGLVSDFTIPNLENFKLEDADDDVAIHEDEFVAEVVSTVVKTCSALIQPTIHYFPRQYSNIVKIQVIELLSEGPKAAGPLSPHRYDESQLAQQITDLNLVGQTIEVSKVTLNLATCRLCNAAVVAATKSRTSTVFKGGLRTTLHDYLDSAVLHYRLKDMLTRKPDVAAELGLQEWVQTPEGVRVIPVFLFDLRGSNLLLLDRFHQALSFPDMVLAVQTNAGLMTVDYSCGDDVLSIDSRDASRPILAATLEAVWGVEAPYKSFNPATGAEDQDFTWSIGYCPWGPFSQSKAISFSQRDASLRNLLYSTIYQSSNELADVIDTFAKYEMGMGDVLLPGEYQHYIRRFNVFNYKLEKAAMYMSLLNFNTSLFYARSLRHDARALTAIFARGAQYVHSHMACSRDDESSILRDTVFLAAVCVLIWVVLKAVQDFFKRRGSKGKRH